MSSNFAAGWYCQILQFTGNIFLIIIYSIYKYIYNYIYIYISIYVNNISLYIQIHLYCICNICQYQPAAKLLCINIPHMSVQQIFCSVHHFCCMWCATYGTLKKFKRIKKQVQHLAEVHGEPNSWSEFYILVYYHQPE